MTNSATYLEFTLRTTHNQGSRPRNPPQTHDLLNSGSPQCGILHPLNPVGFLSRGERAALANRDWWDPLAQAGWGREVIRVKDYEAN